MPPPHLDRLIAGSTPPPSQPSDCWLSLPHPHPPPCAQPPPHPPPPAMRARASSRAAPPPPPHDPRTANNLHPPASHPPGLVPLAPALTANNLHHGSRSARAICALSPACHAANNLHPQSTSAAPIVLRNPRVFIPRHQQPRQQRRYNLAPHPVQRLPSTF
jgi:hypothetical protein